MVPENQIVLTNGLVAWKEEWGVVVEPPIHSESYGITEARIATLEEEAEYRTIRSAQIAALPKSEWSDFGAMAEPFEQAMIDTAEYEVSPCKYVPGEVKVRLADGRYAFEDGAKIITVEENGDYFSAYGRYAEEFRKLILDPDNWMFAHKDYQLFKERQAQHLHDLEDSWEAPDNEGWGLTDRLIEKLKPLDAQVLLIEINIQDVKIYADLNTATSRKYVNSFHLDDLTNVRVWDDKGGYTFVACDEHDMECSLVRWYIPPMPSIDLKS